jgi:hypothetical protein
MVPTDSPAPLAMPLRQATTHAEAAEPGDESDGAMDLPAVPIQRAVSAPATPAASVAAPSVAPSSSFVAGDSTAPPSYAAPSMAQAPAYEPEGETYAAPTFVPSMPDLPGLPVPATGSSEIFYSAAPGPAAFEGESAPAGGWVPEYGATEYSAGDEGWTPEYGIAAQVVRAHAPLVRGMAASSEAAAPLGLWSRVWGGVDRVWRSAAGPAPAVPMDVPAAYGWSDAPALPYASRRSAASPGMEYSVEGTAPAAYTGGPQYAAGTPADQGYRAPTSGYEGGYTYNYSSYSPGAPAYAPAPGQSAMNVWRSIAARGGPISSALPLFEMAPGLAAYYGGSEPDDTPAPAYEPGSPEALAAALDRMYGPMASQPGLPLAIPWGGQASVPGAVDSDQQTMQALAQEWAAPGEAGAWPVAESRPARPRDLTPTWITAYLPVMGEGDTPAQTVRRSIAAPQSGPVGYAPPPAMADMGGYQPAAPDFGGYDGYDGYDSPMAVPSAGYSPAPSGYSVAWSGFAPPPGNPQAAIRNPQSQEPPVADLFWQADGYSDPEQAEAAAWADVVAAAVNSGYTASAAALALSGEETTAPSAPSANQHEDRDGGGAGGDIDQLAEAVYDMIVRRLAAERERNW